jgi:hypothetical protein
MAAVAAGVINEIAAEDRAVREIATPPSSFETEVVREFEPRASEPAPQAPSGPGYAPAEPVRIDWPSDLVQVESDPAKIQTAGQTETVEQPVQRPKRVRQPMQPQIEEPLVQIETGQDGSAPGSTDQKGQAPVLPG